MAKVTFKHTTHDSLKQRFVEKKTFKYLVISQSITLLLLLGCVIALILK